MEKEIVDYITAAKNHGLTEQEIKQNLLKAGWEAAAVENSFVKVKAASQKTELMPKPVIEHTPAQAPVASVPAALPISDAHFTTPNKAKRPVLIFVIVLLGILLLGGGAFGYYTYVLNNPEKTWQKFSENPQSKIYQSEVTFSYSDPNSLNSTSSFISLQNLKFDFTGNVYANTAEADKPQSDSSLQYTYSSGNTSISTGFEYILLDNVLYLNIGNNPILSMLGNSFGNDQKVDWIKIDLKKLEDSPNSDAAQAKTFKDIFSADFTGQIEKIWDDAHIITVSKYVGREKVGGVNTLHFQNQLDKQALKNALGETITKVLEKVRGQGAEIKDEDLANVKFAADSIIDKIEVQNLETWIGTSDFRLYKIKFASNAPSVISAIQYLSNVQQQATANSRDAKRLADIRQLASALELYYNDNNGYPDGKDGIPLDITPTYIGMTPSAPIPADGQCTDYYNTYWYQPGGTKKIVNKKTVYDSYSYTYCLGDTIGGYKAGIAKLSPIGISDNIACPSTDQALCVNPNASTEADSTVRDYIQKALDTIQFNATVKIEASYHDYGKIKELTPPADSFDIMEKIQNQYKSFPDDNLVPIQEFNPASVKPITQPGALKASDHTLGNLNAKNIFIVYDDFQCPACRVFSDQIKQIPSQFKDTLLVFRNFPLTQIHPNSASAAYAAQAAGAQEKFWEMYDQLYKHQEDWSGLSNPTEKFVQYAQDAGVKDINKFRNDLVNKTYKPAVEADWQEATGLNVPGTPTFYFNGHPLAIGDLTTMEKQAQQYYK